MSELISLFLTSMLISLVSFGGGAQALFYQTGVAGQHWLESADLSAMLAFGYATPGPAVFGTATFIGYHLGGVWGALIGSVGIFIVPFVLAVTAAKYFSHLLENPRVKRFIQGVGLAAAGLVAVTAFNILEAQSLSLGHMFIAGGAFALTVLRKRTNPLFILVTGAVLGLWLG